MYKNSLNLKINNQEMPIGDPFVIRHNGKYYLYPSSEKKQKGLVCFSSRNLVDWEYQGVVADDPVLINAYAPEVIYAHGKFYLAASPSGNGHYIFIADKPTGPFKRITENIGEMIDGTFYLDKNNTLYFGRAHHGGITINKMNQRGLMKTRKDLFAPTEGWTEGPFFIDYKKHTYLTYCGNFVLSEGYHVDYATSKRVDGDYRIGINNPLLISTQENYNSFGHSMNILGPNLVDYYICYHVRNWEGDNEPIRNYAVDRLQINGRLMAVNPTNRLIRKPQLASFWTDNPLKEKFILKDDYYLSTITTTKNYVLEYNFKDQNFEIYFEINKTGHQTIKVLNKELKLSLNGEEQRFKHNFDFQQFKTIRLLLQDNELTIYLDHVLFKRVDYISKGGKFGFKTTTNKVFYLAANNINDDELYYLPGTILIKSPLVDLEDEINYLRLKAGENKNYTVDLATSGKYLISFYGSTSSKVEVLVNGQPQVLATNKSTYDNLTYILYEGIFKKGNQKLELLVIKGEIKLKAIRVEKLKEIVKETKLLTDSDMPQFKWLDKGKFNEFEIEFEYQKIIQYRHYGMIINATNFSQHRAQTPNSYNGYFIGFRDSLLVLNKVSYRIVRLFDRPYEIKPNTKIKLKVIFNQGFFKVYLNDEFAFEAVDSWSYQQGLFGTFKDVGVEAKLLNYQALKGDMDEKTS